MKKIFSFLLLFLLIFGSVNAQKEVDKKLFPLKSTHTLYQNNNTTVHEKGIQANLNESFNIFPPNSWTVDPVTPKRWEGSATWAYSQYAADYGDGVFAVMDCFNIAAGQAGSLITPVLHPIAGNNTLSYEVIEILLNSGYIDVGMRLFIEFSTNGGTSWTTSTTNVLTAVPNHNTASAPQTPTLLTTNLSAYNGQSVQVRFRCVSDWGGFSLFLDNVSGPEADVLTYSNELALNKSYLDVAGYDYYAIIPFSQFIGVTVNGIVSNLGSANQTNVIFNATDNTNGITLNSAGQTLNTGVIDTLSVNVTVPSVYTSYEFETSVSQNETDENLANNTGGTVYFEADPTWYFRSSDLSALLTSYSFGVSVPATTGMEYGANYHFSTDETIDSISVIIYGANGTGNVVGKIYDIDLVNGSRTLIAQTAPYTPVGTPEWKNIALTTPLAVTTGQIITVTVQLNINVSANDTIKIGADGSFPGDESLGCAAYLPVGGTWDWYYITATVPIVGIITHSTILPDDAGTISGPTSVCQGQTSVTYTVPPIANATSYVWTLPAGATGSSTTNTITIDFSASASSGNIEVYGHNAVGDGNASTLAITVNPLPGAAGSITGTATVCQGQTHTYTVPAIANATSYTWTLYSGATGSSTTNSIDVSFTTSAASGNILVAGTNSCGNGTISAYSITVNPLPDAAGIISGSASACQGQTFTYTVTAINNATSYVWTLPAGATGTSTTNSITVDFGMSAVSGDISVYGSNACGDGITSNYAIIITNAVPDAAGTISGTSTVCQGQTYTYTVPVINNAANYVWTLPSGATGASTTNSIDVTYTVSAVSGDITVYGSSTCGDGTSSAFPVVVNVLPDDAGLVSGIATVCQGETITYTVPVIAEASSYTWTLPSGATGTSTTNSIDVTYTSSAVSGDISVAGTNSCGDGVVSTYTVTVNTVPTTAGTITGTSVVCLDQTYTYSIPVIAEATSYSWTLPTGATGTSTTYSIDVTFTLSAVTGDIIVAGSNSCGNGTSSVFAVTVNYTPATPTIILNGNNLESDAATGNQWYDQNGIIVGATAQTYTPSANGNYYVIVTDNGCSSLPSNIISFTYVGITENNITEFAVYPNPVTNEINIQYTGNNTLINFEIINSIGQVVYTGTMIEKTSVDANSFLHGIYIIKLENGKSFEFRKIVKE